MYRNKQVGLGVVGYFCSAGQGYEHVCLAGIDYSCAWRTGFDKPSQFQCHVEVDILFLTVFPDGSGVVSSMSGIDNYGKSSIVGRC